MEKTYIIRFIGPEKRNELSWKVFENGIEHRVIDIKINVPSWSKMTIEGGNRKYNLECKGYMNIVNNIAYINSSEDSDNNK
jgi:hypothetical protein